MVRFEKDRFIIEIGTGINPEETWIELVKQLSTLLSAYTDGTPNDFWLVADLFGELMPDSEQAKRMVR